MKNEFHTVRGYELLRQNSRTLTSAMEDYLEMIYRHSTEKRIIRVNELAEKLNVRASSVTKMVQKLGELGLIKYQRYKTIEITEAGQAIGVYLLRRHRIIEQFLGMIGITDNLLVETELIEHHISGSTLTHLEILTEFLMLNAEARTAYRRFAADALNKQEG